MAPTLQQLIRTHPDYRKHSEYWRLLKALTEGGIHMDEQVRRLILSNPDNRNEDVLKERVKASCYLNQIAPIINRFTAQLFQSEAVYEGSKDKFWQEKFLPGSFVLDGDDDGRSSFHEGLRQSMIQALSTGKAIALIDTPPNNAKNKAEQEKNGSLDPYVVLIPRHDMWDYDTDNQGFKFTKIHRFRWLRDAWNSNPVAEHTFIIHQRRGSVVEVSKYVVSKEIKDGFDTDLAISYCDPRMLTTDAQGVSIKTEIENRPIYSVNKQFKFPVVTLSLPPVLWVADQLFDAQTEHFNQTSAISWAILTTNYAMPVIKTNDITAYNNRNGAYGSGYFLHLEEDEDISWTERPGNAIKTGMEYRDALENSIEKIVQQIAISASQTMPKVSGEAIRQAKKPETILLENYGQRIAEYAKQILDCAAIAHGENITWKVNGFSDFEVEDLQVGVQEMTGLKQLAIPSETFNRELTKAFVRDVAQQKDFDEKTLREILEELDEADFTPQPAMAPGETPPTEGQQQPETEDQQDKEDDQEEEDTAWQDDLIDEAVKG